jgi:LuxR family maltose regulon positive regulatory protein
MKASLLATKLHRPTLPTKWVQRPHLSRRLDGGLDFNRQITLVSAPAGFGKTTCVSEWVDSLEGWPVSWLSLDSSDDDPGRFFAYFLAALQKIDKGLGREISGVLHSGQLPPGEVIAATLVNDILEMGERFLLVLDDFHMVQDRFILDVLEKLVTNLPQPLHLVLLTREDPPLPLARFRANNLLTEIRAKDLRFSSRDTGRLLNEVMGLSLSQADIAVLEDKTEGWVAGLQLAGLSIQDRANPSSFIATLSGSHRFILSYLTEEVLNRQPDDIQRFLLQTSILDKLTGDLCDAVTGRSDSHGLLEQLYHTNLFLVPLDDDQRWYRYYHLFADLLRDHQNRRQKDKTSELHQRASRWYAQADMGSEAIQHALAAEDYAMAVGLLETYAMGMVMQGYAKTVNGWVQKIPAEWASHSPRTNLAFAWMHFLRGAYAQAAPYMERLQTILADGSEEDSSLKAEWLVLQSLRLYMQGQLEDCLDMAAQALDITPEQDSRVRSLAYYALACAHQSMEDYPQAVEAFQTSIQLGRAGDNLTAEMMSTISLAQMAFDQGQLHLAFEMTAPVSEQVDQSDSLPPICAVIYGVLGEVYYQWYQLDQALYYTRRTLQLCTLGAINTGMIFSRVFLSRLFLVEGNLEAAAREIQAAVDMVQAEAPESFWQEIVPQQVRVTLDRGRPAAAQMALQRMGFSFEDGFSFPDLPPGQGIPYPIGTLYNSGLRFLLHQARANRDPASLRPGIELANRMITRAIRGQSILIALETLLLRAQMYAVLGDGSASRADYVRVLELAEPEGFIGIFVEQGPPVAEALAELVKYNRPENVNPDYVERILAAFSGSQPPGTIQTESPAPDVPVGAGPVVLVEPLTDREIEVLRLMAEGLKYKEIADRLFISLNTVRYHVKAVYGKFNVNNRTQAIEMARQLHIL